MFTFYVKTDKDGFITDAPALDAADGLTAVTCGPTTKDYLLKYYSKYRVVDGNLQAPANLPDMSIDGLEAIVNQQSATIQSMQQALGAATKAQVQAQQQFTTTAQEFQQQFGSLTQQYVSLSKQVQALQPAPASTDAKSTDTTATIK